MIYALFRIIMDCEFSGRGIDLILQKDSYLL